MEVDDARSQSKVSRRTLLKAGGLGAAAIALGIDALAVRPQRIAWAAPSTLPDIQFDIGPYTAPAQTINGVLFKFGPVYTVATTLKLTRTPTTAEQSLLSQSLGNVETAYPFSPSGVFTFVSYGIPYFNRLPGGMSGALVSANMPRLLSDPTRYALEEAVPGPTDVSPQNPGIVKPTYNVPVVIEQNDVLLTVRSDVLANCQDVTNWLLNGSNSLKGQAFPSPAWNGLFQQTSQRIGFVQQGLPYKVAVQNNLPYANFINNQSPMWMGFSDQQVDGSGPAVITTFQGNSSARFTDATQASYFYDGAVQHLSHNIQDLANFYAYPSQPYTERVQEMFRSDPIPSTGNTDQFTNGGGPTFLDNVNFGSGDAFTNAAAVGTYQGQHRLGHLTCVQRSSRASDGTPIHIRMDGPGFDNLDVPDGSNQPKLEFMIFIPTAAFFRQMRINQASLDLASEFNIPLAKDGIDFFLTATRRQNYLIPPRTHRAFPLLELAI